MGNRKKKTATRSLFLTPSNIMKDVLIRAALLCVALLYALSFTACGTGAGGSADTGEKIADMKIGAANTEANDVINANATGDGADTNPGEDPGATRGQTPDGGDGADLNGGGTWAADDNSGSGGSGDGGGGDDEGGESGESGNGGNSGNGGSGGNGDDPNSGGGTTPADAVGDTASLYKFSQAELDAMSGVKTGWGVVLNGNLQPEAPAATREMFSKYNTVYVGNPDEPVIYLTFDLGYESGNTEAILDILHKRDVRAVFFITGHYLSSQPEIVRRIIADGHIVANHTLNHAVLPDISDDKLKADILDLEVAYTEATGYEISKIIRPPNGEYSERSLALSASLGYKTVLWSFAFVDYDENQFFTIEYAYKKITDNLHNGAVILLHAVHKENAFALDRVIAKALEDGYTFSTLDKINA